MSKLTTTIDLEDFQLEVEIEYEIEPGERRTWDYPGSPPCPYLIGVKVLSPYPVDRFPVEAINHTAYEHVQAHWDIGTRFGDRCLEDEALREEAAEDRYWDDKFERRRLGE